MEEKKETKTIELNIPGWLVRLFVWLIASALIGTELGTKVGIAVFLALMSTTISDD